MATTIAVSEETHRTLVQMKTFSPYRSMDELLREVISVYKQHVWDETSVLIRRRAADLGVTLRDLVGPDVDLEDME